MRRIKHGGRSLGAGRGVWRRALRRTWCWVACHLRHLALPAARLLHRLLLLEQRLLLHVLLLLRRIVLILRRLVCLLRLLGILPVLPCLSVALAHAAAALASVRVGRQTWQTDRPRFTHIYACKYVTYTKARMYTCILQADRTKTAPAL